MTDRGLKQARQRMNEGFFYENLIEMARGCREEADPNRALTAFVLHGIFFDLAKALGDKPVTVETTRKMEARYRTAINLALEETLAESSLERRVERLTRVIHLHWHMDD